MAQYVYEQKADSIKAIVEKQIFNQFLFDHIPSPHIDDARILMLLIAMDDARIPSNKADEYISSAMLVQIALDTHEQVGGEMASLKERQLTVLAGDYFSGLYYHLLSNIEDVEMIRTLARAIKMINEYKISVYQLNVLDMDGLLNHIRKIEATLIEQLCLHINSVDHLPLFEEFLFLKRLKRELEWFTGGRPSVFFEGLAKFCLDHQDTPSRLLSPAEKQKLIRICRNHMESSRGALLGLLEQAGTIPRVFRASVVDLAESFNHIAT